jgi:hypothetical protein
MTVPIASIPRKKRPVRRGRQKAFVSAPPAALTLVSVAYVPAAYVELTFDRPVETAMLDFGAFTVSDADIGDTMTGTLPESQPTPSSVRMNLIGVGGSTGPGIRLTAGATNGIVPAGGGTAWAGVTGLVIPFG